MELKTYRVATIEEALAVIRRDLGPDASVLHTREVSGGLWNWISGQRVLEVTASTELQAPSRLPPRPARVLSSAESVTSETATAPEKAPLDSELPLRLETRPGLTTTDELARAKAPFKRPAAREQKEARSVENTTIPGAAGARRAARTPGAFDYRSRFREALTHDASKVESLVERMSRGECEVRWRVPSEYTEIYSQLIAAEFSDEAARWLIARLAERMPAGNRIDARRARRELVTLLSEELPVTGAWSLKPGACRVVALVGPTGVGKTTTIAKLAANLRLREKQRVGLITVDTYRVAAIEQLRTYAEIIDLPMEVVTTPREMREAVARLAKFDVVLVDTAGRSPRDAAQLQGLKSLLAEARANEVHLVLSATSSSASLVESVEQFSLANPSAILITKLDEVQSLGHLLALARASRLPISYLTHGQNVPDDIRAAESVALAEMLLGGAA